MHRLCVEIRNKGIGSNKKEKKVSSWLLRSGLNFIESKLYSGN
jgi:hypothetical protein